MARHTGGWVKLYRKAVMGDIGANYTRSGLFGALIAMANIQESTVDWGGEPRTLSRGEIVTSIAELASLGETDRRTVDRHLAYLAQRETITYEKRPFGTFIRLLNYSQYQDVDADSVKPQRNDMLNHMPNRSAHNEERKNKRTKETKGSFQISSGKELITLLSPEIQSLYPAEYVLRESIKAWDWCLDNSHKTPKSEVGFRRFFKNWLARGWEDYRKSLSTAKASGEGWSPYSGLAED